VKLHELQTLVVCNTSIEGKISIVRSCLSRSRFFAYSGTGLDLALKQGKLKLIIGAKLNCWRWCGARRELLSGGGHSRSSPLPRPRPSVWTQRHNEELAEVDDSRGSVGDGFIWSVGIRFVDVETGD
jgi:hypothetical protein